MPPLLSGNVLPPSNAQVQRVSRVLAWVLLLFALALPVAALVNLLRMDTLEMLRAAGLSGEGLRQAQSMPLPVLTRALDITSGLLPVVLLCAALLFLRSTFLQFAQGVYFSSRAIAGLRNFALLVGLVGVTEMLLSPLHSVLLTIHNGVGQKQLVLAVSSSHVMAVVVAACVWVVAWVMGHAASLQEENRQFI
ncbi:MAG: hypothetical protein ACRCV9_04145 [Burkholderiaceae bacterium]